MADGVAITAGSGTTILTDDTASGHAQVVKLGISTDGSATLLPASGTDGLLVNLGSNNDVTVTGTVTANIAAGTKDTWIVSTTNTAHVAAARTTLIDLFNATGSGKTLRIVGIYIVPTLTAVTGVGQTYEAIQTSAVGTGGSTATPRSFSSTITGLPAQVTARTKPTGGATTDVTWLYINGSSEETNPYAGMASVLNHVPNVGEFGAMRGFLVNEDEGIKIDQTTNSSVGSVNVSIVFTAE